MELMVVDLGLINYQAGLDLQFKILKLRQAERIGDVLLLLEHPPVITLGLAGKKDNILLHEELLSGLGVCVYHTNRGGDVTYHGPGQIVGYPILNLKYHCKGIKDYIWRLEETFIRLLKEEYGIIAARDPQYPGVWVGNEKITALGCAVKRWVTMHGFAFNVNTNLEHFRWINPCGIMDRGVTSLERLLGFPQDLGLVRQQVSRHFSAMFNLEPVVTGKEEFLRMIEEQTDEE
ncbi:MAG: lipoyl(octanoyl) transferase LipB [Peptococcaceae bacterium]|nr:lipoyl(octanoyl) transferase LipB [Peptococcaceae bacterium]